MLPFICATCPTLAHEAPPFLLSLQPFDKADMDLTHSPFVPVGTTCVTPFELCIRLDYCLTLASVVRARVSDAKPYAFNFLIFVLLLADLEFGVIFELALL